MIELEHVTIENFGTIERIDLVLNTPGLTLITGLNKDAPKADSNGSGKSLLLDAICWCLWGETVRGLTTDDVVRRQIGKDCAVTLKFKDGKTNYLVTRHRKDTRVDKPNDLKLFINGVEKGKKMKNLQELIDQIIGFDFSTFCAMMPGAGVNVAALTDIKIKELLEKLLQTEQLAAAYSSARDRLKVIEAELSRHAVAKQTAETALTALEHEVQQLKDLEQSFENKKAEDILSIEKSILEANQQLLEFDVEIAKGPAIEAQIKGFKDEIDSLQKQVDQVTKSAGVRIKELKDKILSTDVAWMFFESDKKNYDKHLAAMAGLGDTCPTCESPIPEGHVEACRTAYATRNMLEEENAENAKKVSTQLNAQLQNELAVRDTTLKDLTSFITMKQGAIGMLNEKMITIRHHINGRNHVAKSLATLTQALEKTKAESHNFASIFEAKTEKADKLAQEVCQAEKAMTELGKEEKLCRFWVEGFSPAGLRSYMLDYVTPILNDRAAYYSEVLTSGEMKVTFSTKTALKKGDLKDKFQILVEQKHGGDLYKATSKGEKARADLVIAMALGDLATFRTAKQLPWRFLDEPFENIDDAGNEAIIQLLNEQKARYKTVFVVTHKPAFKQLFTQRITVVKEKGISHLEHG